VAEFGLRPPQERNPGETVDRRSVNWRSQWTICQRSESTWKSWPLTASTSGTVDHMEGADKIKLTKSDRSSSGQHHLIPIGWVHHVDTHVHLTRTARRLRSPGACGLKLVHLPLKRHGIRGARDSTLTQIVRHHVRLGSVVHENPGMRARRSARGSQRARCKSRENVVAVIRVLFRVDCDAGTRFVKKKWSSRRKRKALPSTLQHSTVCAICRESAGSYCFIPSALKIFPLDVFTRIGVVQPALFFSRSPTSQPAAAPGTLTCTPLTHASPVKTDCKCHGIEGLGAVRQSAVPGVRTPRNAGTLVVFRCAPADAALLAPHFDELHQAFNPWHCSRFFTGEGVGQWRACEGAGAAAGWLVGEREKTEPVALRQFS